MLSLAAILALAVLFGSSLPLNRVALGTRPGPHSSRAAIEQADLVHIAVHLGGYAALACLAWFVAGSTAPGRIGKCIAFSSTIALGYGTEYLQHRVYRHPIEWNDVLADSIAASIAFIVLAVSKL